MSGIRMKRACFVSLLFLWLLLFSPALGEVTVSADPCPARVGDEVRIVVSAPEGAVSVVYDLSTPDKHVFRGRKPDSHFVTAFRPRAQADYTLSATVEFEDRHKETARVLIPVSGFNPDPVPVGPEVIYSQKDGWWNNKAYTSKNTLENAGCALFTLSHALQRMGYAGEDVLPTIMAKTWAGCLGKEGTRNEQLITLASQVYRYKTESELWTGARDIADALRSGAMFSFGIVNGHIALVAGLSEDGSKARIVDSSPSATFERIRKGSVYYLGPDGSFVEAQTPEEMPGFIWYFENAGCNGMEYYMDLSYVAQRGARLIRPPWLFRLSGDQRIPVSLVQAGSALCQVLQNDVLTAVPTAALSWASRGTDTLSVAVVKGKKRVPLRNGEGKRISSLAPCSLHLVTELGEDSARIRDEEQSGYVSLKDVEIIPVSAAAPRAARITLKGSASGRATIKIRYGPSQKAKILTEWKTGVQVAVTGEADGFFQVEGNGLRGWIAEEYITMEVEPNGQKINEGE